jgi:hypothetical protein
MTLEPLLIISGRKFGGDGGDNFDDSSSPNFTSSHYVSGFVFSDIDVFDACQFIYTSSHDNQSRIESSVRGYGGNKIKSTYKYYLTADERIELVQVKSFNEPLDDSNDYTYNETLYESNDYTYNERLDDSNDYTYTQKLVRGLKFVTTKGQRIPPGPLLTGNDVQSENFTGYTLGYVTGRSGQKIDQLQFFWYRMK